MKSYLINDEDTGVFIGTLLYYEKSKDVVIELTDSLDEWNCPFLFTSLVKQGIYTIPRSLSKMWINERIIPSGRQNIQSILSHHKLKSYDEMKFLEISSGRCSQDSLYIKPNEVLPEYVLKRQMHNLTECTVCSDDSLLCFFADNSVEKINLKNISFTDKEKVLGNPRLLRSACLTPGGYSISFNNSIDIPAGILYKSGSKKISSNDILSFVRNNLCDTSQSCKLLQCTRQNLSYLTKNKGLIPIKCNAKGNLYMKGSLLQADEA